jgi:hypothetical protein
MDNTLLIENITQNGLYRGFDYGLTARVGIAHPVNPIKIFIEGRYHLGLRDLTNNGIATRNRGISVNVGILLPVGK